jgi:hypothetical protein
MKTHRPKTVACPVCHDRYFASGADAVSHVESGYCPCMLGRENARQKIYNFTSRNAPQLLADVPRIGYGDWQPSPGASEKPYRCNMCLRKFGQMSSLLSHQADSHGHAAGGFQALGY